MLIIGVCGACGALFGSQTESGSGSKKTTTSVDPDENISISAENGGSISVAEGSDISGAGLTIPPGALSITTEVNLANGGSLDSVAGLSFSELTEAESAGTSVKFEASKDNAEILNPMTLALPVSQSASLTSTQLAVIYQVKIENGARIGLIDKSNFISQTDTSVKIEIENFGTFQVIRVPAELNVSAISALDDTNLGLIVGTWGTGCVASTNNKGETIYKQNELTVKGTGFKFEISGFPGNASTCEAADKNWTLEIKGSIVARDGDKPDQYKELDILMGSVKYTANYKPVTESLNTNKHCGLTGWETNVAKSIEGPCSTDSEFPYKGAVIYDIFNLSGNNVTLGGGSSSPETRPPVLSTDDEDSLSRIE